jgi:hypothetical protein
MRRLDNFDPSQAKLDSIETLGRDLFHLTLTEWIKFRHAIAVGNDASELLPQEGKAISEELKIEYQTLAKSHYQSVSHLISGYQCHEIIRRGAPTEQTEWATYFRAQPEFYFHIGACLDGIARVAYILLTCGQKNRSKQMNLWDFGRMRHYDKQTSKYTFKPEFVEIGNLVSLFSIEGIYLIRHGVTHGWQLPGLMREGRTYWPEEIRTERFLAWPYIEFEKFKKYTWNRSIEEVVANDYSNVEKFFNASYLYFISKIGGWERNNNVLIADR